MSTQAKPLSAEPSGNPVLVMPERIVAALAAAAVHPDTRLRLEVVKALTGKARSTIYALIARGAFPAPIRESTRCSRWLARDVLDWLKAPR